IVDIENGDKDPVMYVGNLEATRDFTDVRDMVAAYFLALEKGRPGEVYNICSESHWTIQAVLDKLLSLSEVKIEVKQDPRRLRPSDVPRLLGDCSKFKKDTGWQPTIPFETTLNDMLAYWRQR
ncbi:MAG: GDP-mannose 4,6-dehydratase, partial [Candidatus Krumholzibacteria bacterium]|nr:GDP-mannose 4,6-dehydratase [Candidatus Krumholzibacteria bacterium]